MPQYTTNVEADEGITMYCLNLHSALQPTEGDRLTFIVGDKQATFNKQIVGYLSPFLYQIFSQITLDCYFCSKEEIFISLPIEMSIEAIRSLAIILENGEAFNIAECVLDDVEDAINLLDLNITLESERDYGNGQDNLIKIENTYLLEEWENVVDPQVDLTSPSRNEFLNCSLTESNQQEEKDNLAKDKEINEKTETSLLNQKRDKAVEKKEKKRRALNTVKGLELKSKRARSEKTDNADKDVAVAVDKIRVHPTKHKDDTHEVPVVKKRGRPRIQRLKKTVVKKRGRPRIQRLEKTDNVVAAVDQTRVDPRKQTRKQMGTVKKYNFRNTLKNGPQPKKIDKKYVEKSFSRRSRCRNCEGCLKKDCRVCKNCIDMKKYDGPGLYKQACEKRICTTKLSSDLKSEAEIKQMVMVTASSVNGEESGHINGERPKPGGSGGRMDGLGSGET